jgi:glycosyltransferase involved in cell wall biosynthesis
VCAVSLGIIARSDNTGLGNQTRELVEMLNPEKILLIDSTPFNKNKQHPEWYAGRNVITSFGFPEDGLVDKFLNGLEVILSCEIFYSDTLVLKARALGIKTILQYNYELFQNLSRKEAPLPDVLLSPSLWNIDRVKLMFGKKSKVIHLPPPTNYLLFDKIKQKNLSKDHNRLLHIVGRKAAHDRNGTESVMNMLKYSKADYELVIQSQTPIESKIKDSRLKIKIGNPANREDMYGGFDGMILPRKYAGLCLPMNEALFSGLPVFMTDISPNNKILPNKWLTAVRDDGSFMAKTRISLFSADPRSLARVVDDYVKLDNSLKLEWKKEAIRIAEQNFSVESLRPQYLNLINGLRSKPLV